ncbi:MAG: hypothetical protein K2X03_17540 [Bryobacteraceae bacterium]|nr:hypothetical protein [Bryobacteraceae bacterium]
MFAALIFWLILFTNSGSPNGLLSDAATGFHIRTGERILDTGSLPYQDPFSFSKPGQTWYAWEWLADLLFAAIFQMGGLKWIVVLSAATLAGCCWLTLRAMVRAGANALAAIFVLHAVIGAGSVHFLARPHIFTILFLTIAFGLLWWDQPGSRRIWWLMPLTAVWVNLHGGFAGLLVTLAVLSVGSVLEGQYRRAGRWGGLLGGCLAASLVNPYGYHLHVHMADYLRADWIRKMVQEFQAPVLETASGVYFECLLFAGLAAAARLAWQGNWSWALLVAAWGHASLLSVRHVPIFAALVAPPVALMLSDAMGWFAERDGRKSVAAMLQAIGREHAPNVLRMSAMIPALLLTLLASDAGLSYPADFPEGKFPVAMIAKHRTLIEQSRLFTLDAWGDYLVYRHYPRQQVFFDGRTDYYGRRMSEEYLALVNGGPGWRQTLHKYGVNAVMLSTASPLTQSLALEPGWQLVDTQDAVALYRLSRKPSGGASAR